MQQVERTAPGGSFWSRAGNVFVLWGGVIGFPAVAALAEALGSESTALSIVYRALVAGCACALLVFVRRTCRFDAVTTTIEKQSSTAALKGSTEDEQFFDTKHA